MTLENLFLVLVPTYLALVAYGVVGARKRSLGSASRFLSIALLVLIPPVAILVALYSTGDAFLLAGWGVVMLAMLAGGIGTAALAWFISGRTA